MVVTVPNDQSSSQPDSQPVVVTTVSDGVADVRLNRPGSLNAFNDAMFTAVIEAAARLRDDPAVRAVVLSGNGRAFCSGLDTRAFDLMREAGPGATWRPEDADEAAAAIADVDGLALGRGQRAVLVWQTMPVPVIAAVHGAAVGLGLQLALGADIRIVAPDAKLGALEIRWGLAPDSAGTLLLAQQIAARSPEAIRSVARLIRLGAQGRWQEGLIAEREEMHQNTASNNQREAIAAAREKRSTIFSNPT
jgi:enoyl-CoA hydratase/carnithine racemase